MMRSRIKLLTALLALGLAGAGCTAQAGAPDPDQAGCEGFTLPPGFADLVYDGPTFGRPPFRPIVTFGTSLDLSGARFVRVAGADALLPQDLPADVTLRVALGGDEGALGTGYEVVQLFYGDSAVDESTTFEDLIRGRAIRFVVHRAEGDDAATVKSTIKDRAALVRIGPHDGAVVHSDPIGALRVRTWDVYWSDGRLDYSVESTVEPDELARLTQSLYCQ